MKFTKDHTLCMKGIAILLMFFHHNYLGPERWLDSPINFFPFTEDIFVYVAKFCKICVGLFVLLTGYGMTVSCKNRIKTNYDMRKYILNRYLSLMLGFILVFLIIQIASIFTGRFEYIYGKGTYAWIYFVIDALGLAHLFDTPTFCPTWWYMSLAVLLIILFPLFRGLIERYQGLVLAAAVLVPTALDLPFTDLVRWLFCYCLGIYIAQHDLSVKIKEKFMQQSQMKKILCFICMVIGMGIIIKFRQSGGFGMKFLYLWEGLAPAYVILFSYIFLVCCKPLAVILKFLGKHSMNMFLIHTMFRAVFFHDFIYSFYYAWIDYIVLIIVSVASSMVVELIKKIIHFDRVSQKIKSFVAVRLNLI